MRRLKILLVTLITTIILMLSISVSVSASTYEDIQKEVSTLVNQNILPSYHLNLSYDTAYQTLYNKMYRQGNTESKDTFKEMSESNLRSIIKSYKNDWDKVWFDILTNLDVEPEYLDPNRVLGLYYDSNSNNNSYLYLIWTSHYIPSEFMTVYSFELNDKEYKQYPTNDLFEPFYYDSKYYHFEKYDLTIHLTPIGGIENDKDFGIPLTQKYKFKNIKVGLDKLQYENIPNNLYEASIDSYTEFDLGMTPKPNDKSLCQLVTHAYKLIKDCEVQSHYDLGFGGYMHYVHFNTTISIDKIYRVDVCYDLTSDNKDWYQFWLNEDIKHIEKSMRPDKKKTGIFGLYDTYGFKEGSFKSNEKDSIEYKYEMMLNYKEQNWDWFGEKCIESNYKRIKDFKILRLNYLVEDQVYDVAVTMDNVDGKTLSIVDRSLILDTESSLYKVKDKIYSISDGVNIAKNVMLSIIGIIAFLLIFYYGYIGILKIKEVMKDEK